MRLRCEPGAFELWVTRMRWNIFAHEEVHEGDDTRTGSDDETWPLHHQLSEPKEKLLRWFWWWCSQNVFFEKLWATKLNWCDLSRTLGSQVKKERIKLEPILELTSIRWTSEMLRYQLSVILTARGATIVVKDLINWFKLLSRRTMSKQKLSFEAKSWQCQFSRTWFVYQHSVSKNGYKAINNDRADDKIKWNFKRLRVFATFLFR